MQAVDRPAGFPGDILLSGVFFTTLCAATLFFLSSLLALSRFLLSSCACFSMLTLTFTFEPGLTLSLFSLLGVTSKLLLIRHFLVICPVCHFNGPNEIDVAVPFFRLQPAVGCVSLRSGDTRPTNWYARGRHTDKAAKTIVLVRAHCHSFVQCSTNAPETMT